jgi:hypothetical protein
VVHVTIGVREGVRCVRTCTCACMRVRYCGRSSLLRRLRDWAGRPCKDIPYKKYMIVTPQRPRVPPSSRDSAAVDLEAPSPERSPRSPQSRVLQAREVVDARRYAELEINPTLTRGLVALCQTRPEQPVKWLAEWLLANKPPARLLEPQVPTRANNGSWPGGSYWESNEGPNLKEAMKNVKLIKLSSLIRLAEKQAYEREKGMPITRMPRCQDWDDSDVANSGYSDEPLELMHWERPRPSHAHETSIGSGTGLPIIVLSICWLAKDHPDERGEQLALLLPIFRMYNAIGPYAVLWDFCSLPQKEWASEDEKRIFKLALKAINEWYQHRLTTVIMVTQHPQGVDEPGRYQSSRPYDNRGWTRTEKALSSLRKSADCLLDTKLFDAETVEAHVKSKKKELARDGWGPPHAHG